MSVSGESATSAAAGARLLKQMSFLSRDPAPICEKRANR